MKMRVNHYKIDILSGKPNVGRSSLTYCYNEHVRITRIMNVGSFMNPRFVTTQEFLCPVSQLKRGDFLVEDTAIVWKVTRH